MLEYLKKHNINCRIEELEKIVQERASWPTSNPKKNYPQIIEDSPVINNCYNIWSPDCLDVYTPHKIPKIDLDKINNSLRELIPWRKGPFKLFDICIDAEWRSDHKWKRIKDAIMPLNGKTILDIGCNNGYYMFQMAKENPRFVLGIDPMPHYQAQFNMIQKYAKIPNLYFELLGFEHLKYFTNSFDVILSMGIIYHHSDPIGQLIKIKKALKNNGKLLIETIGIPGNASVALFPENKYAKMSNVWFIPTISCLINWLKKANYKNIEIVSDTLLTPEEQRSTEWYPSPYQSLQNFLDPFDSSTTVEGYDAPRRFAVLASGVQ